MVEGVQDREVESAPDPGGPRREPGLGHPRGGTVGENRRLVGGESAAGAAAASGGDRPRLSDAELVCPTNSLEPTIQALTIAGRVGLPGYGAPADLEPTIQALTIAGAVGGPCRLRPGVVSRYSTAASVSARPSTRPTLWASSVTERLSSLMRTSVRLADTSIRS